MTTAQTPPGKPLDFKITTLRFNALEAAPRLASIDLSSPFNMDGAGVSRPQSTVSSPNLFHNPTSPTPRGHEHAHRRITPRRAQSTITTRKTSTSTTTSIPIHVDGEGLSSPTMDPIPQEDGSPWSSAVGRATLGKSGRVIERLMADVDRLKRELNIEISHRQEVEKREESSRSRIETIMVENTNLKQGKDIDAAALRRRDRKIDELRAELHGERERRITAQTQARDAVRQKEEAIEQCYMQVAAARDQARYAESHAEVLEQSYMEQERDYREQTDALGVDIHSLLEVRAEEHQRIRKLDIVVEQMRHELDCANKVNEEMVKTFAAYKEISDERLRGLQREKESWSSSERRVREETERVLKEAKWLVNIGKMAALVQK